MGITCNWSRLIGQVKETDDFGTLESSLPSSSTWHTVGVGHITQWIS